MGEYIDLYLKSDGNKFNRMNFGSSAIRALNLEGESVGFGFSAGEEGDALQ